VFATEAEFQEFIQRLPPALRLQYEYLRPAPPAESPPDTYLHLPVIEPAPVVQPPPLPVATLPAVTVAAENGMPAHWETHPTDANLIWDVNFDSWITKPTNYDQIMRTVGTTGAEGTNTGWGFAIPIPGETLEQTQTRAEEQAAVLSLIAHPPPHLSTSDINAMIDVVLEKYPERLPINSDTAPNTTTVDPSLQQVDVGGVPPLLIGAAVAALLWLVLK
jgi:hypothetical protein